jgi:hypothetical protein
VSKNILFAYMASTLKLLSLFIPYDCRDWKFYTC